MTSIHSRYEELIRYFHAIDISGQFSYDWPSDTLTTVINKPNNCFLQLLSTRREAARHVRGVATTAVGEGNTRIPRLSKSVVHYAGNATASTKLAQMLINGNTLVANEYPELAQLFRELFLIFGVSVADLLGSWIVNHQYLTTVGSSPIRSEILSCEKVNLSANGRSVVLPSCSFGH